MTTATRSPVADLDGDGRPELLSPGRQQAVPLQADNRTLLDSIRSELGRGRIDSTDALVGSGWLAPGATSGNLLAHIIGGPGGGSSAPPPVPYPDPENNPGGSSTGSGGSTAGSGGGLSTSVGDEAGVSKGVIKGGSTSFPNPG